jgi:hypothetical protein
MNAIGIDLSLRSTGLCFSTEDSVTFSLVQPSIKDFNDEALCIFNANAIISFVNHIDKNRKKFGVDSVDRINLEGLSFGSLTGSKDILAGNFWYVRCMLHQQFPEIPVKIVPVLSWRSPMFNKEERKWMKDCTAKTKSLKSQTKGMKKKEKDDFLFSFKDVIEGADIKIQTFNKLPEVVQTEINRITTSKDKFDLADAYCLSRYNK